MGGGLRHVPLILFNSLCHFKKKLPYFPHPECRSVSANGVPFVFFCIPLFFLVKKKRSLRAKPPGLGRPVANFLFCPREEKEFVALFPRAMFGCFFHLFFVVFFFFVLFCYRLLLSLLSSTPPPPTPARPRPPFYTRRTYGTPKKKQRKNEKKEPTLFYCPTFPTRPCPPPRPTTWTSVGKLEEVFFLPFGNRPMGSSVATAKLGRF